MLKITVCIGSSCHLKGSRQVAEKLQALIDDNGLGGEIALCGGFCMGNCVSGVSVSVCSRIYSLRPESTAAFFEGEILPVLKKKQSCASEQE